MELFDVVNAIFSKRNWKDVSRIDKDRYFFMINRFISIAHPKQASIFNLRTIPKEHVLDYWNRQLSKLYSKIPDWVYTKGIKSTKAETKVKYDNDLVKMFCEHNKCSKAEFEMILSISPKEVEKEMDMYYLMLKAKKQTSIEE